MPNLADSHMCDQFVRKLTTCERRLVEMSDWEQSFIKDIRAKFAAREDQLDLGVTPWNPSHRQWNTLGEIYRAYS